ncbi:NUDIX hydrolase [Pinisolibacter aquiterrae]|uniref:NUDIX hydrolase n=1 Tax=Pinisolibacter aquiterrae TaxID=2815579 RepID=UPI001C3D8C4E|nr:NUDIX domain-containing protein [Pinisolibacter aquiterrae]MBV5263987.1 NUDIX domain-containing protein [Pinisolibacter aquiterrae]MCC8233918.1 NUDIX domain-containing protein [Pinisolibacter aquiterrae]
MRAIADILDELNALDRSSKAAYYRPRDAATLLILDRGSDGALRVLMGKRHMRHKFMPGAWVFPGGRVDPADSRARLADDYDPAVLSRLTAEMKGPKTATRARAFAVAAIRETYEEAGVLIGRPTETAASGESHDPHDAIAAFRAHGVIPAIGSMRFVARAITPPGRPRRFDTRFFAVAASAIGGRLESGVGPSGELEDVAWVTFPEARARPELLPITRAVMDELETRLTIDPDLGPDHPVPFYYWERDRFLRKEI